MNIINNLHEKTDNGSNHASSATNNDVQDKECNETMMEQIRLMQEHIMNIMTRLDSVTRRNNPHATSNIYLGFLRPVMQAMHEYQGSNLYMPGMHQFYLNILNIHTPPGMHSTFDQQLQSRMTSPPAFPLTTQSSNGTNNIGHLARNNSGSAVHNDTRDNNSSIGLYYLMNILEMFSHKDSKRSGSDEESYDEFVEQYFAASRVLCLTTSERHQYLHNFFRDKTLYFQKANANGRARDFSRALRTMKEQFNLMSKKKK